MGYDPATCYHTLTAQGKPPCPNDLGTASAYHCLDAQESGAIHTFCGNTGNYYAPFQFSEAYNATKCRADEYNAVKCEEKVFATVSLLAKFLRTNPDFDSRDCYCCCSCIAYGTPIAVPSGVNAIEKIAVGDEVMGAKMEVSRGKISFSWTPATVSFSQGTPPTDPKSGIASTMVYIYCDEDTGLIATQDQLMLMSTGKMKQAGALNPGDELVKMDGTFVPVHRVKIGNWYGGVHHISINKAYTGDIGGHLISANGFVIGDFALQMNPEVLGDKFENAPMIGHDDYDTKHKALKVATGVFASKKSASKTVKLPKHFKLFAESSSHIPDDACQYVTTAQAVDIIGNPDAHFRPFGNKAGIDGLQYLFKLYKGFYPDFNFYLDWEDVNPNAYAFKAYGVKNVVISGGLIRLDGLYIEAQALIIAHCIATLADIKYYEGPHPLPRVLADYYGVELIMATAWDFNASTMVKEGMKQVEKMWSYIAPEERQGDPADPQGDPSIDCRLDTLMYARLGGELPECAQPAVALLELIGEKVGVTPDKKPYVSLVFNRVVDEASAQNPANYTFVPAAKITSVQVQQSDGTHVQIVADFKPEAEYSVTVANVTAGDGTKLNPQKNNATFEGP